MRRARRFEELDRALEMCLRLVHRPGCPRGQTGPLVQRGLDEAIVGELDRPLERPLCLGARGQRRGSLGGAYQHVTSLAAQLLGVRCVRGRPVCIDVVGGHHLDDLVFLRNPDRLEVASDRNVLRLPLLLRERLVHASLDDVLEEGVHPALRRAGIGLDRKHFLAHEGRLPCASSSASSIPVTASAPCFVNVLPSTDASWTMRRSSVVRPSSRAAMSASSVSGTASVSTGPVGR